MSERPPQQPSEGGQPEDIDQIRELLHTNPWQPPEKTNHSGDVDTDDHDGSTTDAAAADTAATSETDPTERPRIWVGSWLDYNNGILHGDWIDADRDQAAVWADISAMLARSPTAQEYGDAAEEWGIFDYENFGPLRVGEQESLSWVTSVARGIREHGLAFAAYADVVQDEEALAGFEDDYLGHYDSLEAYAEHYVDDAGYEDILDRSLPEGIRHYVCVNTPALARDLHYSGDIHVIRAEGGGVWLFRAQ